ncbi:MAG: hypothetical protein ACYC1U_06230 [Candidatus Aquicultorales bacterium]
MSLASSAAQRKPSPSHKIDLILDPKASGIDRAFKDILAVTREAAKLLPATRLKSIRLDDPYAVVLLTPVSGKGRELAVHLFKNDGGWEIKSCRYAAEN